MVGKESGNNMNFYNFSAGLRVFNSEFSSYTFQCSRKIAQGYSGLIFDFGLDSRSQAMDYSTDVISSKASFVCVTCSRSDHLNVCDLKAIDFGQKRAILCLEQQV